MMSYRLLGEADPEAAPLARWHRLAFARDVQLLVESDVAVEYRVGKVCQAELARRGACSHEQERLVDSARKRDFAARNVTILSRPRRASRMGYRTIRGG